MLLDNINYLAIPSSKVDNISCNLSNAIPTSNTRILSTYQNTRLDSTPPSQQSTNSLPSSVILDTGCTDTSYRVSDVAHPSNITYDDTPGLVLTTASGHGVQAIGTSTRSFGPLGSEQRHGIHVFDDDQLAVGMHSLADFTNHPSNNTVLFDANGFRVFDKAGTIICANTKQPSARLWHMPGQAPQLLETQASQGHLFVRHEPSAVRVSYMAGCFFNPCDSTLIEALSKGWIAGIPGFNAKVVRANPPHSMSSAYGHLNRLRQNLRSTSKSPVTRSKAKELPSTEQFVINDTLHTDHDDDDSDPNQLILMSKLVSDLTPTEKKALALYFDATGKFPFESISGNQYVLI